MRELGAVLWAAPPRGESGWYAVNRDESRAVLLGGDLTELGGEEVPVPIHCPGRHHSYIAKVSADPEVDIRMRVDSPVVLRGDDLAKGRPGGVRATLDLRGSRSSPASTSDPLRDPFRWPQVATMVSRSR